MNESTLSRCELCDSGEAVNEVNIIQVSKWLLCVYKSMDEFGQNSDTVAELKALTMIPLADGRVTSAAASTVFFPVTSSMETRGDIYGQVQH